MDAKEILNQQLEQAHGWFDATLQGVGPKEASWVPAGKANTIAACYAHTVLTEDWLVNTLRGGAPLFASVWAGKTGISEMPPQNPEQGWGEWGKRVQVDLGAAAAYKKAVVTNTQSYINSLTDAELNRMVPTPAGTQSVAWLLNNVVIGHVHDFTGEISCLKGLQGLQGYPA